MAMTDNIIKLTEEHAARTEEEARVASNAGATAGAIFERRDPVKTLAMQPQIVEVLSTIFDPEIPVNIYDLGLIYEIDVKDDETVKVKMTLTAPACPVAGTLPGEVEKKVNAVPEVKAAEVELVWEPAWSRDRMSEAALLQLGMF
jgi:FeS assembly SUF system protein